MTLASTVKFGSAPLATVHNGIKTQFTESSFKLPNSGTATNKFNHRSDNYKPPPALDINFLLGRITPMTMTTSPQKPSISQMLSKTRPHPRFTGHHRRGLSLPASPLPPVSPVYSTPVYSSSSPSFSGTISGLPSLQSFLPPFLFPSGDTLSRHPVSKPMSVRKVAPQTSSSTPSHFKLQAGKLPDNRLPNHVSRNSGSVVATPRVGLTYSSPISTALGVGPLSAQGLFPSQDARFLYDRSAQPKRRAEEESSRALLTHSSNFSRSKIALVPSRLY